MQLLIIGYGNNRLGKMISHLAQERLGIFGTWSRENQQEFGVRAAWSS